MAQSKREAYESERRRIRHISGLEPNPDSDDPTGLIDEQDAEAILELCDAYDAENTVVTPNDADSEENRWGTERAPATLRQWAVSLTGFARDLDGSLVDASADDLNRVAQRMYDGEAASVTKPLSKNTVRSRQNSLKKFLRHADVAADPDAISRFDQQSTLVDPEDMLTREEFHALRNAPEHPRDKAIVDLLLYTGQRNTAIRTLRVRDVDVDGEKYRLNDEADGLKGADLIGTWNPLLGATGNVREWLRHHPDPENDDAYLLTERRNNNVRDPTTTISDDTVNRVLREAAEAAAEEHPPTERKPTTAHAMRHNFVTMCKRDYQMDDDLIKRLIRHKPESDVMNTTYAHLSDEDYMERAREIMGYSDPEEEDESPMTPEVCDNCSEPLPPNAKACPGCGVAFTPDAEKVVESDLREHYREADDLDTLEKVQMLDDLLDDPEVLELLEKQDLE